MAERPLIAICASRETASWTVWRDQPAVLVGAAYVERVQAAGGTALVIAPAEVADPSLLDGFDGLLLPGGLDVDPGAYGQEVEPVCETFDPARDSFELALAREALDRDLPLLGICRGLQLINVALGGTLEQDIASRLGTTAHRAVVGSLAEGNSHEVEFTPGTATAAIARSDRTDGRSHHHQAVSREGEGVIVSGRSVGDGIAEAIEVPGKRFAIGVQWHAEATPDDRFIPAFVEAARAFRSSRTT